jgi:hypothetical protein
MVMKMSSQLADENQKNLYKKFPSTHYLSNQTNVYHVLLWNTFFRRNLHRLAIDYLKINLHIYQAVILYLMGICNFIVIVACRAAAKSFIIALYACCRCITRPYTKIVLSSATKGQSKLIVTEKIKNELMNMSPTLRAEIRNIKDNQNEVIVYFRNGSTITVVPASENGRGFRSHCCIREEFRQIDKNVDDSILSPFQTIRQAPYMLKEPYSSMRELQEDPCDIYISSSWLDNGHWMWNIVDQAYKEMLDNKDSCLLAFDESITLKHNIRTMKQMRQEKKKQDPLTWRLEFMNERVKENTSAFFTYSMMTSNQRLKQIFYPRFDYDVRSGKKNKYYIPKQDGEIRLVSCDIAFVENKANDNSIFTCMRLLPETTIYNTENSEVKIVNGYRRIVSFIQSVQGGDTTRQALAIRRLYEDFGSDYICLDTRNGGVAILDMLSKVMYDEDRNLEYSPLSCMNNENFANRIKNVNAKPVIYAVNATQQLNSDIAFSFREVLSNNMIDFLVNYNEAVDDILPNIKDYVECSDSERFFYEQPFFETQLLISETASLVYEKMQQTGVIKIHEQGANRKDRYTSCSYGSYFASLLEQDLLSQSEKHDYAQAPRCIGTISF